MPRALPAQPNVLQLEFIPCNKSQIVVFLGEKEVRNVFLVQTNVPVNAEIVLGERGWGDDGCGGLDCSVIVAVVTVVDVVGDDDADFVGSAAAVVDVIDAADDVAGDSVVNDV